jgi:hypothetical protein
MPDKAHTTKREEKKKALKTIKEKRREKRAKKHQSVIGAHPTIG